MSDEIKKPVYKDPRTYLNAEQYTEAVETVWREMEGRCKSDPLHRWMTDEESKAYRNPISGRILIWKFGKD